MIATKKFYDKTADIYDMRQQNNWTDTLRRAEIALISKYAHGCVLDIGCGTGFHLAWLSANTDCELIGLDVSPAMLSSASITAPNAKLVEGNAERIPFGENEFDTVLCMFSTLNLCDYNKALAEIRRVLKPNGHAILSVSSMWDNSGKSEKRIRMEKAIIRLHLFEAAELRSAVEQSRLRVIEFDSIFRAARPRWGDWQSKVIEDMSKPVDRGAMYLLVLEKR